MSQKKYQEKKQVGIGSRGTPYPSFPIPCIIQFVDLETIKRLKSGNKKYRDNRNNYVFKTNLFASKKTEIKQCRNEKNR